MDGLRDVIFVKMFAHGINQYHTTIIMKQHRKNGLKILILSPSIGTIKLGKKILKELL